MHVCKIKKTNTENTQKYATVNLKYEINAQYENSVKIKLNIKLKLQTSGTRHVSSISDNVTIKYFA